MSADRPEPALSSESRKGVRRPNFLTEIIDADLQAGRVVRVATRFPPEPNGYLHIGHAKSICLNFGLAQQYGGTCNLRMDDTNPVTEDVDYVQAIERDVAWLGFRWQGEVRFASDYFDVMYRCAEGLIERGLAYVDSQTVDQIREGRGSFERPGVDSPFRTRPIAENLDLFRRMRAGEFKDGSHVLRGKIDMAHPNVLMRDPLLYRIRHAHHHRTGDQWCIYPMYDYAHPLEDAVEGITHSICTLEFESNRELYDWVLDHTRQPDTGKAWNPRPHQYEFARLAMDYTVMSKRKLLQLVEEKRVGGWDDPRMPTLAGMRRRGVTPDALRDFADLIGVAKNNSLVDIGKLEFCIRQDLEKRSPRAMAVLEPLPVTITNWPAGQKEDLEVAWWPNDPDKGGTRKLPFSGEILIDRSDFAEDPPPDWKRLAPGREVRLLGAYFVRCEALVRDASGRITSLRCTYDPDTRGGEAPVQADGSAGRQPQGTLHWVDAQRSLPAEVRSYDRLFGTSQPDAGGDFLQHLNPTSLEVFANARVEPALKDLDPTTRLQFVRVGYFWQDPLDSRPDALVFDRVISLRDTWARATGKTRDEGRPDRKKPEPEARPRTEQGPARKTRGEIRAELRALTPELAERFARYQAQGVGPDEADLLTGDLDLARYFDTAVQAHPQPVSVARWLVNDLLGLLKDRPVGELPLDGATFGRFVALVDAGTVTGPAGKALLAHLAEKGGDPQRLVAELGLARIDDPGAVAAAVQGVLQQHAAEVARYRAGEQKLLGVLLGATMRGLKGTADAQAVRQALTEALARAE